MAKHKRNNGFTLIESLLVLLIVSLVTTIFYATAQTPLYLFMKQLQTQLVTSQQIAYVTKNTQVVDILEQGIVLNDQIMEYPFSVSCEPIHFHFNASGNISKAGTIVCHNKTQTKKIILQLGSGRMRIE